MPKILWVALPPLLAAAALAVQVLRRRAPSRRAINIGSSVLLLAYVATTASLGAFRVANQQLPVFDPAREWVVHFAALGPTARGARSG